MLAPLQVVRLEIISFVRWGSYGTYGRVSTLGEKLSLFVAGDRVVIATVGCLYLALSVHLLCRPSDQCLQIFF